MFEHETLERFKAEALTAFSDYLDRLTLPALLDYDLPRPLSLTLNAALKTSGPLPEQALELSVSPLQTTKTTHLLTSGATPKEPSEFEDCFSPEDLARIPFLS